MRLRRYRYEGRDDVLVWRPGDSALPPLVIDLRCVPDFDGFMILVEDAIWPVDLELRSDQMLLYWRLADGRIVAQASNEDWVRRRLREVPCSDVAG